MPRRKEAGSLTGSKRVKEEKAKQQANSIGAKAKAVADAAGTILSGDKGKKSNGNIPPTPTPAPTTFNTSTTPTLPRLTLQTQTQTSSNGGSNNTNSQLNFLNVPSSGNVERKNDPYGGVALPQYNFAEMVPGDLLNPQIQLVATEEQLAVGLAQYAAGTRAQHLLQAGFRYIEEVGKSKQQFHKAQSSFVKAATEEVKVKQDIVEFDIQNVELAIKGEKLNQANERLKQEEIKTTAAQNETVQLVARIEATEGKRQAEIQRINAQTQGIIAKYLTESIKGAA